MTQLTIQDASGGDRLKGEGQDTVAIHAENFVAIMRKKAREISAASGMVSADNLRPIAIALGLVPHHPNAWGGNFYRQALEGGRL